MELNIGTNIKRLRLDRGMTQEQLAELLSVSTAAVSKWEAKNTYPDITLLFPIAEIFGVSVDELLGYDEEKARTDIDRILAEYKRLYVDGRFKAAKKLIVEARKNYPHDYRIMNKYMWDKALGSSADDENPLLVHKDEFLQICNCILDGCTVEKIRIDAINMKAKLLHASGDTEAALELLSELPKTPTQFMKEALFGKGTPEFAYWNRKNYFGLMDEMSIRIARDVRFDSALTIKERIEKLEVMGETFAEIAEKPGLEFFCIGEQAIYIVCAGMLTADNAEIADVIRIREKQFAAMEKMMRLAESEQALADSFKTSYGTDNLVAWELNRLANSPHQQFANLRKNKEYAEFLMNSQKLYNDSPLNCNDKI